MERVDGFDIYSKCDPARDKDLQIRDGRLKQLREGRSSGRNLLKVIQHNEERPRTEIRLKTFDQTCTRRLLYPQSRGDRGNNELRTADRREFYEVDLVFAAPVISHGSRKSRLPDTADT